VWTQQQCSDLRRYGTGTGAVSRGRRTWLFVSANGRAAAMQDPGDVSVELFFYFNVGGAGLTVRCPPYKEVGRVDPATMQ